MVVCRFRPFNTKEIEIGAKCVASFDPDGKHLVLKTQVSIAGLNFAGRLKKQ